MTQISGNGRVEGRPRSSGGVTRRTPLPANRVPHTLTLAFSRANFIIVHHRKMPLSDLFRQAIWCLWVFTSITLFQEIILKWKNTTQVLWLFV